MTPDMSVSQMLDSFIYIVQGSRVIDRHDPVDWATARWMSDKFAKSKSYTVAELKRYFSHRRYSKWNGKTVYLFDEWLSHPHRFMAPTLSEAIKFADMAARGQIQPRIDIDSMIKNSEARANTQAAEVTPPVWVTRHALR